MLTIFFYNLSLIFGILVLVSLSNWFLLWCSIELITALLVVIISRNISPRGVEGMSKYFIAQAIASAFLLLGVVYRYYNIGEVGLFSEYDLFSYALIMVGLFLKIAVIPNPYWFIDSISGLKFFEGFYIIIMSKIIPIYIYINISDSNFSNMLLLAGVGSVVVGSILALNQTNIRKIIALSSIAHLGWLLIGLPWLDLSNCIFIFASYIFMVLPIVWLCGLYQLNDLNNLKRCYNSPVVIFILIVSLLSLGGFPPLLGFFYKLVIFLALLESGSYLLCSFLIIMSLVSLFFYLRICYNLYSLYSSEIKLVSLWNIINNKDTILFWLVVISILTLIFSSIFCLSYVISL